LASLDGRMEEERAFVTADVRGVGRRAIGVPSSAVTAALSGLELDVRDWVQPRDRRLALPGPANGWVWIPCTVRSSAIDRLAFVASGSNAAGPALVYLGDSEISVDRG
jgi:hypothetical protein